MREDVVIRFTDGESVGFEAPQSLEINPQIVAFYTVTDTRRDYAFPLCNVQSIVIEEVAEDE